MDDSGRILAVNKELLPVKAHNFLKYGARAVFSFLPVIVRQKGVPNEGVGLMWTFFPAVNILSYLFLSQIADRFSCHRLFFMSGIILLSSGLAGICFLPDISRLEISTLENVKPYNVSLQCKDKAVKLWSCNDYNSDSEIRDCAYNYTYASFNRTCEMKCSVDLSENIKLSDLNNNFHKKNLKVIKVPLNSNSTCVVENCINVNLELEVFDLIGNLSCDKVYIAECEISCSPSERKKSQTLSMSETVSHFEFWLLLLTLMLMYSGDSTATNMCDTATFELLGENRHLYGNQRLWGSLARGIMGILYGVIIDYFSRGLSGRDYTVAFIISIIIMVGTIISGACIKFKIPKREATESGSILRVLSSGKVILFMGCILVVGGSQGCLWTFLFMIMEDVAVAWNPDFQGRTLLQGLTLAISCFGGEVPLMYLSGHIIRKLGNIRTFTLALVAYSVRFLLHSFVVNPWYFLPIEILHGLSFGVFYPNMSAYASKLSPKGQKATMQGIVKATFAAGMSLGSLIGGAVFKLSGGSQLYFYIGIFDTAFTIFFVLCHIFLAKRNDSNTKDTDEIVEAKDPEIKLEAALLSNGDNKQIVNEVLEAALLSNEDTKQIDNEVLEEKKNLLNEIKA